MPGNIVTASVGSSAGGVVIPEASDAGYATWPSFAQKTVDDILAIYAANVRNENSGQQVGKVDNRLPAPGTSIEKVTAAVFSRDTLIIFGILVLAVLGIKTFLR